MGLPNVRLTSALQGPSIDEVEDHTVGKFLAILVRWVWCAEVAQMEAFGHALLVVFRGAEDKVSRGVDFDPSTFPELPRVSIYP